MPGRRAARPYRAKGSSIPRLAGVSVVLLLAVGGLAAYLASTRHSQAAAPKRHEHTALSSRVLKVQNVGIVDFGPADDGDSFVGIQDDHPLMLLRHDGRAEFVVIPASALAAPTSGGAGVPAWTDNQMADGSHIFIYTATNQCLSAGLTSAGRNPAAVGLARCNLSLAQRWRPIDASDALGQALAKYANAQTGGCLTAPPTKPGPASLTSCGALRLKNQEIAFWWVA
jgi:hypothetical protein